MGTGKQYSEEYKKEAVKLAKEIGNKAAAEELGIPKGTIGTWVSKAKAGEIFEETFRSHQFADLDKRRIAGIGNGLRKGLQPVSLAFVAVHPEASAH